MGWRRFLLLPHVVRAGLRAPRERDGRWDRYWADVRATGDGGDVLWDASAPEESRRYLALLAEHADPRLPVVDIGCGNGRFTRALAERFARAVGVDVAPHAVARAAAETPDGSAEFRAADMTAEGVGARLAAELGPSHVFIRGVLHVLDAPARRRLAENVRALVADAGVVLVAETNHRGPLLGYLESLGGTARGLPPAVDRAIASGIPAPRAFGGTELGGCFTHERWERVVLDDRAEITAIPMQRSSPERIPALLAVLRPRGAQLPGQSD